MEDSFQTIIYLGVLDEYISDVELHCLRQASKGLREVIGPKDINVQKGAK
jgi:hypothetical protein